MFNFDVPRYEKVVGDAIALRPQIEKAVDEICKEGYSNIFFIGCGGTYAHSLPMKYWFDTTSEIETHSVIAAEFMVSGHKRFTKDSVCVFSTRSGNTKEIVELWYMYQMIIHQLVNMQIISSSVLQKMIACVKQFIHI